MKRKIWIIITACLAVVLVAAACLFGWAARRGIGISQAAYIETSAGPMVLLQGSPVRVSGKEGMFEGLTMGDQVLLVHGPVMESYPGQTNGYLCIKRADGMEEDIPKPILQSLREMGWLPTIIDLEKSVEVPEDELAISVDPRPLYEDEVIELAKAQVNWNYYAVTAEQAPETGNWTVTFWSRDRERFQVVIVGRYGRAQTVQPPANQDEAIAIAEDYKTFDYYASTAEQDPETGDWTVTFWSRDRETFQVVIVSRDGCVLRVTEGRPLAENP